jgi:hypothetical protein
VEREHSRRDLLRAGGAVAGGAVLGAGFGADPAGAAPAFAAMTAGSRVAARTDRRPVAGGVFDATANKTFFCWAGRDEDTFVQEYDHGARRFSAAVRLVAGRGDSHNYPTIVQARDGRLLIFIGMHNTELIMARSPQPRSIGGTWAVGPVPGGRAASYPMPFRTANGNLFVFFRETTGDIQPEVPADTRPMLFVRSTDNGVTWRGSTQLTGQPFVLGSTGRTDHLNEIYIGQLRLERATGGRPERVHLVWTLAGGGPDKHEHDFFHKDIYYATFEPATLRFRTAGGKDLGMQVGDADLASCRVVTTPLTRPGDLKSPDYIQLVGWLGNGRPLLVWMTYDGNQVARTTAGVWTGSAWRTRQVATGLRVREMERVDGTTWRVFASREISHDVSRPNIETFLLTSSLTWTAETTITTPTPVQRVELVTGFRDPARLVATGASSARDVSVADGDVYVAGVG